MPELYWMTEVAEVGPVVVPEGRDYAAARMRNAEKEKVRRWEGEKVREGTK